MKKIKIFLAAVLILPLALAVTGCDNDALPDVTRHTVEWNEVENVVFTVKAGTQIIDKGASVENGANIYLEWSSLDPSYMVSVFVDNEPIRAGSWTIYEDTKFEIAREILFPITHTTNMSNGTVTVENGVAWFTTGIPSTETANPNFGRQSGTIQINQIGATVLCFDVLADMQNNDWIVFTVNVGHSAATVDSCHIGIRKDSHGDYFIGGVTNWPYVHHGSNNGIPNLDMVNQHVSCLRDITITFSPDYRSAEVGSFVFYPNRELNEGSNMIRNLWLVRTNMSNEIGVTNMRIS
ncbi:MAG: hypothetical protein FWE31_03255 [Firmicutes bacterium]|nr:hypothetical protein [Bacillota bacterium]